MDKELSTFYKLHDEINSELILKDIVHANNKRMIDAIKDFLFHLQ